MRNQKKEFYFQLFLQILRVLNESDGRGTGVGGGGCNDSRKAESKDKIEQTYQNNLIRFHALPQT